MTEYDRQMEFFVRDIRAMIEKECGDIIDRAFVNHLVFGADAAMEIAKREIDEKVKEEKS